MPFESDSATWAHQSEIKKSDESVEVFQRGFGQRNAAAARSQELILTAMKGYDDENGHHPSPTTSYQPLAGEDGVAPHHQHPERWTSGICACFDDMPSCCLGFWCPCILFGRNVELLEGKPWIGPCIIHVLLWGAVTGLCCALTEGTTLGLAASCVSCYACGYRKSLRERYNLEDAPCGDFLTHFCCHMCAICQEYREIKERTAAVGLPVTAAPSFQSMDAYH